MADSRSSSRRNTGGSSSGRNAGGSSSGRNASGSSSQRNTGGSSSRSKSDGLSARDAIQRVRELLPELLGHPVESVLGVERNDDDLWEVTVQILELARVPNSTDVLGAYHVTLDQDGELAGYQRSRRYTRGQADEG